MRTNTTPRLLPFLAAGLLLVGACGDDAGSTETGAGGGGGETTEPKDGEGTINLRLEPVDGIFIEGFEIGLRFTDAEGEVIDSLLWNEYVESLGASDPTAYYTSVLDQPVPAGTVTVEASVVQSIGGPIEPPDLTAEFPCSLDVEVPEGGTVEVQVAFTAEPGCITEL